MKTKLKLFVAAAVALIGPVAVYMWFCAAPSGSNGPAIEIHSAAAVDESSGAAYTATGQKGGATEGSRSPALPAIDAGGSNNEASVASSPDRSIGTSDQWRNLEKDQILRQLQEMEELRRLAHPQDMKAIEQELERLRHEGWLLRERIREGVRGDGWTLEEAGAPMFHDSSDVVRLYRATEDGRRFYYDATRGNHPDLFRVLDAHTSLWEDPVYEAYSRIDALRIRLRFLELAE